MPELELIVQHEPERRRVIGGIIVLLLFMVILGLMIWPAWSAFDLDWFLVPHVGVWLYISGKSAYRIYHIRSQHLRIGPAGISWRLSNELAFLMELWRPPISQGEVAWSDITELDQKLNGIHIHVGEKEHVLPLNNFEYAPRQQIKAAIREFHTDLAHEKVTETAP